MTANLCAHTMLSPLLKKAEEKAGVKKEESPDSKSGSPPVKKLCTVYSKQLARLPQGDQGLVKERGLKTVTCLNNTDSAKQICSKKINRFLTS